MKDTVADCDCVTKKVAVIYEKTVKKTPAIAKVFASWLLWGACIYSDILSVRFAYMYIFDAEGYNAPTHV